MILDVILKYFSKICSIPHDSFCEKELADYIVDFANKKGFFVLKDNFNNVYIKKTVNENKPYTIFQSHLDMVCVKDPNYYINFKTDPIKLVKKGNYLTAYKTSLGADNGIGVAIILALLDKANFNIEALFTTDEEVSTTGACNFDYTKIIGKKLISLDGFRANEIILGCSSICDMKIKFNSKFEKCNELGYKLTISGLKGGHSGADIDKNLGNSIKIANKLLNCFNFVKLENFESGNQFNFIPNFATVSFSGKKDEIKFNKVLQILKNEYPLLRVKFEEKIIEKNLSIKNSANILNFIQKIKSGVLNKNSFGIVLSQNLASINLADGLIKISQRGSNENLEKQNITLNNKLAQSFNFNFEIFDKKPGFYTNPNCNLVKDLIKQSRNANKIVLKRKFKHVSLEECIFQEKMPGCEMVVVSPKIDFPHSTKERVLLPSVEKTYNLLLFYLKNV